MRDLRWVKEVTKCCNDSARPSRPGFGQRPPERLGHKQAHDNDAEVAGFVTEAANVRYLETELALEGGIHARRSSSRVDARRAAIRIVLALAAQGRARLESGTSIRFFQKCSQRERPRNYATRATNC
ncbi:hypothetical protein Daci_3083 [Delftia acidovorans SPH-1]|uniref:Uncharacterized protein n=1 Tax=Delftia acidovorans (strain DSM 14801 / SPH-1) TaxID=398578 RepID=A9BU06_DELAS|nr:MULTISPECIES: hypothetical protein [Delftia]ABX35721.1 hypothetical protein Daci_3083 [Delftia acidovorans SPH-1]